MLTPRRPLTGMRAFAAFWIGQGVSLFGSSMLGFALTIWAWEMTGTATALALMGVFSFGPTVLLSPIAGALVDRLPRKRVLIVVNIASMAAVLAMLALYAGDRLQIWHLYATGIFAGAFHALHWPAYSAAVTLLVPAAQRARASGLSSLAESAAFIVAPVVAGAVLAMLGLGGIMLIDLVTFGVAIGTLALIAIPDPAPAQTEPRQSVWRDATVGFRYILDRAELLLLQLGFLGTNLAFSLAGAVRAPMILTRTGNDEIVLGTVQSAGALGGACGGLLLSVWGGPKRRVHGVFLGWALTGTLGVSVMGLGRGATVWVAAAFMSALFVPIINGCNQSIWQEKVPPHLQGRVFSVRRLVAMAAWPLGMLVGGPLADHVFEPAMRSGGRLRDTFASVVGAGVGSGMALMLVLSGVLAASVAVAAYLTPAVRDVETRVTSS